MIIGITGTDGAGKGTVVAYLVKEKGFTHYSARALIIEEIEKRGVAENRENMRLVANDLRRAHGNDFVVAFSLQKAEKEGKRNIVIESIRTVGEATTLKEHGGILLCVDADRRIRFERISRRGSSSDHVTFEEFVLLEEKEMSDADPDGPQKAAVMRMADYTVRNDVSESDLFMQIEEFLHQFAA
jgi:dephospho-CoA kinase